MPFRTFDHGADMRVLQWGLAAVIAGVAVTSDLAAQTCLGLASFREARMRVAAAAYFPKDADAYAAALTVGRQRGGFLGVGYGRVTASGEGGEDLVADDGFLELGYQVPVGRGGAQLCPVAGGGIGSGPTVDGVDYSSEFASAGLAFGVPLGAASGARVIPNASVRWEYLRTKGDGTSESESSGILDLGLGVVLADRISIQPTYSIPFSSPSDEDPIFGLLVGISFGRRGR